MRTRYTVLVYHAGTLRELLTLKTFMALRYARRVQERGAFTLTAEAVFQPTLLATLKDARVVIWREPAGGTARIDFAGKVRGWRVRRVGDSLTLTLRGWDYNDELYTRIVAYPAGSKESAKNGLADDVMKAIVRENLGALAAPERDISATGFEVEADFGAGTSLSKGMAWENVVDTLQEISAASFSTPATGVTFGVVPLGKGTARRFETHIGQWGADLRQRLTFSETNGNVVNPEVEEDALDEVTYLYAGGQGEQADRLVQEASDPARIAESPLNRREAFFDGGNYETPAALTAVAQAKLREGRPVQRASFEVQDTEQVVYGRDWNLGDLTLAQVFTWQYSCHVAAIEVQVSGRNEVIKPQLELWQ